MRTAFLLAASATLCGVATIALAQDGPRPSQLGSVTQQINETRVTLDYSRPVARGREIFGKLVPWGQAWTPGANDATTITLSTDVKVNGETLKSGTYTVWAEPQADRWTIMFNSAHPVWHQKRDEVASKDVLRLTVAPREAAHMETLAWYFPVVDGRRGELVVHWGKVMVPLQIEVP
jgi:hypothetical protein